TAVENRPRRGFDVVRHAYEFRRDATIAVDVEEHVAGARVAVLRPADTPGVHAVHAVHHAVPRHVRMPAADNISDVRARTRRHLREEVVGTILEDVDR